MRLTEAHRGGSRHPKGKTGPLPLYLGCSSQQPPSRPCTAFDHADRSPRAVWRPTRNARLYSTLASRVQAATPLATVATASLRGSKGPSTVAHLRRLLCRRVATRAAMPSRPRRPAAQGASRVRTSVETAAQSMPRGFGQLALSTLQHAPIKLGVASSLARGTVSRGMAAHNLDKSGLPSGCGCDHTGLAIPLAY